MIEGITAEVPGLGVASRISVYDLAPHGPDEWFLLEAFCWGPKITILVKGKKTVVILSRAGFYSEGPGAAMDGQEPYLRAMLGFVGLDDVTWIRAEKLAFGPEAAAQAIEAAAAALHGLARETLPLAA